MKKVLLALAFLNFSIAFSQTNRSSVKLSIKQLQEDFDTLYKQLQSNHPDLFAQWPKFNADKEFQKQYNSFNQPLSISEFDLLASRFVSRFQDGHTFVSIDFEGKAFMDYTSQGGRIFPLGIVMENGTLYCASSAFSKIQIPIGAEIISINGQSAQKVIQALVAVLAADDKRTSQVTAQRLFGFTLWKVFGWGTETIIRYKHNKRIFKATLPGISREEYMKLIFGNGTIRHLHILPEESLAILQIDSYNGLNASRRFIDSAFTVIKEKGLKHVALDLRKNGGGNSQIGDMVLAYITDQPYLTVSTKTWKDGPIMRALPTDNWRYNSLKNARDNWQQIAPNYYKGSFSPRKPDSLVKPELFSKVNFYLLISGRTYSSAHMTALSVKCGKLGKIIGQPSGERLDLTGEIAEFILPHSKLPVWVPTALYTTGCGNGKQVGVQPDYFIPFVLEDLKAGKDTEVDFLKSLIQKERSISSK